MTNFGKRQHADVFSENQATPLFQPRNSIVSDKGEYAHGGSDT